MMRAAMVHSFGAPECINVLSNLEKPKMQKAGQILVRVLASGVNPIDGYIRSGEYGTLPKTPYIPGRDGAGVVDEVAAGVKDFKKGDRVWFYSESNGATAEFLIPSHVFPLPDDLSFSEGAALPIPYLTAYRSLFLRGPALKKDAKVLVHGASGGVGLAACQLAAWKGYTVVGTAGTAEGSDNVLKNGASAVYNHRHENYVEKLKDEHSTGFDLIIEMAAHINLNTDLGLLAKNGRVAVVGNRGEIQVNARLLMTMESAVFGVSLVHSTENEYKQSSQEIVEMLTKTKYRPIVYKEYPMEELGEAHRDIMGSGGARGNLVVKL